MLRIVVKRLRRICREVLRFLDGANHQSDPAAGGDLQSRPHVHEKTLGNGNEHVDWVTNPVQQRVRTKSLFRKEGFGGTVTFFWRFLGRVLVPRASKNK